MLQVQFIRENRELVLERLAVRNFSRVELVDEIISLDEERRSVQSSLDSLQAEANQAARQIGDLMRQGKKEEAEAAKSATAGHKVTIKEKNERLSAIEVELHERLVLLPNLPHTSVPNGVGADDNEVVLTHGEIPALASDALPHWEIAAKYGLIDFEAGVKLTGAGFPVYRGKGARLQRALINYFLDQAQAAGYDEVQPPILINEDSGFGTGQLPDKEGQMYHVTEDNLYLIPTAEVPGTNIFRDVILEESQLPIGITGYTPCFRREAGSYGAHVRGLNRLHQFDKVEILRIEHPKRSYEALDEMVEHVKTILKELKLPYRILRLCGGDIGFTSALTYDFEVFSTAQERWLEISSVSNFETFQANRLKLRFRNSEGKNELAHTLNGSSLALPRVLAGILENYQTKDGIVIPEVLVPYTGFKIID